MTRNCTHEYRDGLHLFHLVGVTYAFDARAMGYAMTKGKNWRASHKHAAHAKAEAERAEIEAAMRMVIE